MRTSIAIKGDTSRTTRNGTTPFFFAPGLIITDSLVCAFESEQRRTGNYDVRYQIRPNGGGTAADVEKNSTLVISTIIDGVLKTRSFSHISVALFINLERGGFRIERFIMHKFW